MRHKISFLDKSFTNSRAFLNLESFYLVRVHFSDFLEQTDLYPLYRSSRASAPLSPHSVIFLRDWVVPFVLMTLRLKRC